MPNVSFSAIQDELFHVLCIVTIEGDLAIVHILLAHLERWEFLLVLSNGADYTVVGVP